MRIAPSAFLVGLLLSVGACEKKSETAAAGSGTKPPAGMAGAIDAAKSAAGDTFVKLRDQAVASLEPRLESAKAEVAKLKAKATTLPDALKTTFASGMAEAEKQIGAAGDQLTKLKTAGADTWQAISTDLGETMDKLGSTIKELAGKFPG